MPTTIDDLSNALQSFFATKFPTSASGGPGSVLLVLDQLGTPLDAVEFMGSGTDTAVNLLAHQRAAQLADQLPAPNALASGWYLARSGSRLSRWYQQLVEASSCSSPDPAAFQAFSMLKQAARELFANAQLNVVSGGAIGGSTGTLDPSGTIDNYYATTMSPIDWFEPSATCWTTYQIGSTDNGPVTSPPPSPLPRPRFWLRVANDSDNGDVAKYVQQATISTLPAETLRSAALQPALQASAADTATTDAPAPASSSGLLVRRFDPAVLSAAIEQPAVAQPIASRVALGSMLRSGAGLTAIAGSDAASSADAAGGSADAAGSTPARPMLVGARLFRPDLTAVTAVDATASTDASTAGSAVATAPVRQILELPPDLDFSAVVGSTTEKPPTSNNFHVAFDYCKVSFDRPWWDDVFVDSHGWMVYGYDPGAISSGSATNPSGEITLLTVGMILVRNLSITANWSSDDLAALPDTTSLGPFCVAGASFDQNSGTLTRDGVQAVAWLCQVPPELPPAVAGGSTTDGSTTDGSTTDGSGGGTATSTPSTTDTAPAQAPGD